MPPLQSEHRTEDGALHLDERDGLSECCTVIVCRSRALKIVLSRSRDYLGTATLASHHSFASLLLFSWLSLSTPPPLPRRILS